MSTEVNTQANTESKTNVLMVDIVDLPDDEHVHAGDVNGEPPPMHETRNINTSEENTHHHEYWPPPATKCHQGGEEYTN